METLLRFPMSELSLRRDIHRSNSTELLTVDINRNFREEGDG